VERIAVARVSSCFLLSSGTPAQLVHGISAFQAGVTAREGPQLLDFLLLKDFSKKMRFV